METLTKINLAELERLVWSARFWVILTCVMLVVFPALIDKTGHDVTCEQGFAFLETSRGGLARFPEFDADCVNP